MVTRAELVAEARMWVGTTFVHQHSAKGIGCDCMGLIRGIFLALGLAELDRLHLVPPEQIAYGPVPDGVTLRRGCESFLRPISLEDARPGDMMLFRFGRDPQHTALLGDYVHGGLSLIHALGPSHPGKVVEHRLDDSWRRNIVAAYAIPGVA